MEVKVELALEELKHLCSQWILLGYYLQVANVYIIAASHPGDDKRCLEEVLREWLKKGKDPSWKKLCCALEAGGYLAEAKCIREKYSTPGVCILMKDLKVETVISYLLGVLAKSRTTEVPRGELLELVRINDITAVYQVRGKKAITVHCEVGEVTALNGVQCALLEAIATPMERFSVFVTNGWLEWGAAVKVGNTVYIRVMMDLEHYCTARVHYIGKVTGDQPGTMFGVEITDSRYYDRGTSDGMLRGRRYFSCPVGCGLFLSLASVAKHSEWLKLRCPPPIEGRSKASESRGGHSNQLPVGTRAIVRSKDGRQIRGTVRWIGQIPLYDAVSREEIPVYGIETDVKVSWTDFVPEFPPVNRCTFTVSSSAHGKVFIPVSMVEPDEKLVESSVVENSVHAKNALVEAGVINGNTRQAALMNEQMLATELGPEVTGETSMEEQLELLRRFENGKAQHQQSAYSVLGDLTAQLVVGSAVIIPNNNPPIYGTIRWIGTIPPVHECIAGVELEIPLEECTDGVCVLNGVRYFTCSPNRGYFCQLGQLVPKHSNNMICNRSPSYNSPPCMNTTEKQRIIQHLSVGRNAEVEGDIFKCKGEAGYNVAGVIKILEPMSPMLNYFEYEIINRGERIAIGIGVGELNYPLDRMPGWNINGIGYHADDGRLYHKFEMDNLNPLQQLLASPGWVPFGPTSTTGDRMGCGVDFDSDVGYGYVNIFFTRNGHQVDGLIKMKRPTHGLYPLVGLCSRGEKVRYLGHCRRVPHSVSSPLCLNTSPWLRSNGVRFKDDSLTVEYCGRGLQLEGHDVGVAQANLTANNGNHYFEMEVLSAGKEGLLAIGFAEPTYPLHLYPGSTKGSIAYHAGHLYKEIVPFQPTPSMKCNRIGCGIQFDDNQSTIRLPESVCKVYFTKDGEFVGTVECSVPKDGFYPFVAVSSLGGKVIVNFKTWSRGIDIKSVGRCGDHAFAHGSITEPNKFMSNGQNVCDHNKTKLNQMKLEQVQITKELEELRNEHSKFKTFWIVPRDQVTVLDTSLGEGAWGYVKEGKFRGQQVAVKCIHKTIATQRTIKRVYREICSMAHLRHPNLVLFIAAVLDDQGGPMIITELLDTTLRKAYEDSLLNMAQCMDIFRDVACALCYLHELEAPIIHRDVSSSNVLLQGLANDNWNAKLSDFGSANWAKEASTMGEGAIVYTAPEAYPIHPSLHHTLPPQTTKIDVYSYGILLCEVALREFPSTEHLNEMQEQLKTKHVLLHSLVHKCTQDDPVERPIMATVLEELCCEGNWL